MTVEEAQHLFLVAEVDQPGDGEQQKEHRDEGNDLEVVSCHDFDAGFVGGVRLGLSALIDLEHVNQHLVNLSKLLLLEIVSLVMGTLP